MITQITDNANTWVVHKVKFAFKMIDCALRMMNFGLKIVDSAFKLMKLAC